MKRCPKCNCGAEFTNRGENIFADVVGFGAGLIGHIIGGAPGGVAFERNAHDAICEHKSYKCTNSNCEYEWNE